MAPIDRNPRPRFDWTILYDPECGFCRTALALVLRADGRRRLRPLALGSPEADARLGDLTPKQRAASWHLLGPTGHRESAGAAGPPLLRLLPGGDPLAAILAAAPSATERAYAFVADHRSVWSRFIPARAKERATGLVAARTADAHTDART